MINDRIAKWQCEIKRLQQERLDELINNLDSLSYTFDIPTCAKFLGITHNDVYRLISKRAIPEIRLGTKRKFEIIFSRALFDPWLKSGKYVPAIKIPPLSVLTPEEKAMRKHIRQCMSGNIWRCLTSRNTSKRGNTWEKLVGYTVEELMAHLESKFWPGMSWSNYGQWHIDHIIPDSVFHYTSYEDPEFKECWALSNLQPLWAHDNQSKHAKMDWSEEQNKRADVLVEASLDSWDCSQLDEFEKEQLRIINKENRINLKGLNT